MRRSLQSERGRDYEGIIFRVHPIKSRFINAETAFFKHQ